MLFKHDFLYHNKDTKSVISLLKNLARIYGGNSKQRKLQTAFLITEIAVYSPAEGLEPGPLSPLSPSVSLVVP